MAPPALPAQHGMSACCVESSCVTHLRGVATYKNIYKLTYVRGPSGIIVMLAEELNTTTNG